MTAPAAGVGIHDWAVALPRHRMERAAIVAAHGWAAPTLAARSNGTRAVAWWDEDAITLSVAALRGLDTRNTDAASALIVGGGAMPLLERHPSAIVAAALNLPEETTTQDLAGGSRAGLSACSAGADLAARTGRAVLIAAADVPVARPGSARELATGDGAVAFVVAPGSGRARLVGRWAMRFDMADRQRAPADAFGSEWEDRWSRDVLWQGLVPRALDQAMAAFGLGHGDAAILALPSPYLAATRRIAAAIGATLADPAGTLAHRLGALGAADSALHLVAALESAAPGAQILAVSVGQGIDVMLFQATEAIALRPPQLDPALASARVVDSYHKLLRFRKLIDADTGARGAIQTQAPPSVLFRRRDMLTGFVGGRCTRCGTVQFPRSRYCARPTCRALDTQTPFTLARCNGRLASFTADRLSASAEPPSLYGAVDFEGDLAPGARVMMDIADADLADLAIGLAVAPVFRRRDTDGAGAPRYFWKARPAGAKGGP